MKEKIFRIFSSNIKIRVSGKNINNFIKRLIRNRINIVRVIPISYKDVDLIVNYRDLEEIIKYKTIYDIKITRYYGKLKFIKLIKKNIFILSFLGIGLILMFFLSNVIFDVEVIHSNSKIIKLVNEELSNYGIKKYGFVKSYDETEEIEKKILENNKNSLEWMEIIREGTKYIVRVEERIINSKDSDEKSYNIVAKKNAVIKSIMASEGEKVREINSYVKKGEIIISPLITLPNNEKILKSAKGKVIGEVWYNINVEYPYYYNEVLYTGNKKKVLVFNFVNKRIAIFDFKEYKSFEKNTKFIFKNNFIPVYLALEKQYETKVINDIYTYDEAKDKAINIAKQKLLYKYTDIVKINDVKITYEEDMTSKIRLSLFVTCDEDITEYMELNIENENDTIE